MIIDIPEALSALSKRRPVFCSEFDFQHQLAWELHTRYAGMNILLEYPIIAGRRRMEIDIWARLGDVRVAIELKYKTRKASIQHAGIRFALTQQAATPLGRYDFIKDVERIESVRSAGMADEAWAVMLTNDQSYTRPARGNGQAFSLHAGRTIAPGASLAWNTTVNPKSLGSSRLAPIPIAGTYSLAWTRYATLGTSRFDSLVVEV